jgi:hypothetical protein
MDHAAGALDAEDAQGGRKSEHGRRQGIRVLLPGQFPTFLVTSLSLLPQIQLGEAFEGW